jgi:hypothetical protein
LSWRLGTDTSPLLWQFSWMRLTMSEWPADGSVCLSHISFGYLLFNMIQVRDLHLVWLVNLYVSCFW